MGRASPARSASAILPRSAAHRRALRCGAGSARTTTSAAWRSPSSFPVRSPRSSRFTSGELGATTDLTLAANPDLLAGLGQARGSRTAPLLVGFAAETRDVVANVRAKLAAKRFDMVVANDVGEPGRVRGRHQPRYRGRSRRRGRDPRRRQDRGRPPHPRSRRRAHGATEPARDRLD